MERVRGGRRGVAGRVAELGFGGLEAGLGLGVGLRGAVAGAGGGLGLLSGVRDPGVERVELGAQALAVGLELFVLVAGFP